MSVFPKRANSTEKNSKIDSGGAAVNYSCNSRRKRKGEQRSLLSIKENSIYNDGKLPAVSCHNSGNCRRTMAPVSFTEEDFPPLNGDASIVRVEKMLQQVLRTKSSYKMTSSAVVGSSMKDGEDTGYSSRSSSPPQSFVAEKPAPPPQSDDQSFIRESFYGCGREVPFGLRELRDESSGKSFRLLKNDSLFSKREPTCDFPSNIDFNNEESKINDNYYYRLKDPRPHRYRSVSRPLNELGFHCREASNSFRNEKDFAGDSSSIFYRECSSNYNDGAPCDEPQLNSCPINASRGDNIDEHSIKMSQDSRHHYETDLRHPLKDSSRRRCLLGSGTKASSVPGHLQEPLDSECHFGECILHHNGPLPFVSRPLVPRYFEPYHGQQHINAGCPLNAPVNFYQMNSEDDIRKFVSGFQRELKCSAGEFVPRKNAPNDLRRSWDKVSHQIWKMYSVNKQLDTTFISKLSLKSFIGRVIQNVLPKSRLYIVGSSLSGFGMDNSDVDMCLMVSPRDLDQRNEAQAILRLLQRELNNCGHFEKLDLITAKVPILKCRHIRTQIDIDLNCNNSVGIRNTHLLSTYAQLDWRVQPLVLVTKLWARYHRINNAKDMTISSYSLVLMVIHFLQCGLIVPVLPCLHKAFPDKFNSRINVFHLPSTEKFPTFVSRNTNTLSELFLSFLEYYAFKFQYKKDTISVRCGGLLRKSVCQNFKSRKNNYSMWRCLCIEEPFDFTNTARSVYDEQVFAKVLEVFKDSFFILKRTKNLNQIFNVELPFENSE